MTRLLPLLLILLLAGCQSGPVQQETTDLAASAIIPLPVYVTSDGGAFNLESKTTIELKGDPALIEPVAHYLAEWLRPATGYPLEIKKIRKNPSRGAIVLEIGSFDSLPGDEAYEMTITQKQLRIRAGHPAGLFYGVQTLRQILPPSIESGSEQPGPWQLPTGVILDHPRFAYRGAMLDVARHFFQPADVKRFIDLMALYKLNMLHLHLTDDQGWRIEIKSWPNLALHGGSTQVGGGEGGYYTQEAYADIVAYAQGRFVTIVPEVDMPGHTNAALASYPELNCDGRATKLYTGTNVGFSTLCTDREITYQFITDVFRELAELTPGPWLHIGGDESHVTKLEDYIPFINRVQGIVNELGKQAIGWDDIAAATMTPGTVAQHWSDIENAKKAAAQGAPLILSPAGRSYLDMKYDSTTQLGLKWAGYIEVDRAYDWDPEEMVPGIDRSGILGIEAPLWSETVTNMGEIEYLTFPRLPGFAEIGWTPAPLRSWDEYSQRLAIHGQRLEALGVNYYRSPIVPWQMN